MRLASRWCPRNTVSCALASRRSWRTRSRASASIFSSPRRSATWICLTDRVSWWTPFWTSAIVVGTSRSFVGRFATGYFLFHRCLHGGTGLMVRLCPKEKPRVRYHAFAEVVLSFHATTRARAGRTVAPVAPAAGIGEHLGRQRRDAGRVVDFAEGEQPGIGGDGRAVEFELQSMVEGDPQPRPRPFTPRLVHPPPLDGYETLAVHSRVTRQRHRAARPFGKCGLDAFRSVPQFDGGGSGPAENRRASVRRSPSTVSP